MEPYYQWSFFFRLPADILAHIMTFYDRLCRGCTCWQYARMSLNFHTKQCYGQQFIRQSIGNGVFSQSGSPHLVKDVYPLVNLCIDRIVWKKGRYVAREQHQTGWRRIRG